MKNQANNQLTEEFALITPAIVNDTLQVRNMNYVETELLRSAIYGVTRAAIDAVEYYGEGAKQLKADTISDVGILLRFAGQINFYEEAEILDKMAAEAKKKQLSNPNSQHEPHTFMMSDKEAAKQAQKEYEKV